MDYIIIFTNTHQALKCESFFEENNLYMRVLPTPSYITNSCGISIGIKEENFIKTMEMIHTNDIHYKNIFDIKNKQILK